MSRHFSNVEEEECRARRMAARQADIKVDYRWRSDGSHCFVKTKNTIIRVLNGFSGSFV